MTMTNTCAKELYEHYLEDTIKYLKCNHSEMESEGMFDFITLERNDKGHKKNMLWAIEETNHEGWNFDDDGGLLINGVEASNVANETISLIFKLDVSITKLQAIMRGRGIRWQYPLYAL